jgi:tetratricopeptide (TPR) repeat protein
MAKESVESLCQRAQQAVAQGDNDTARRIYLQALSLKSDAPDVHYGMATVCFLLGDLSSAAYHFKEVTRLDPLRAGAHINLGAVYNRMDKLDEAIPVLRRGIQLDHNRAEGYYNLGVVYRRKGQADMAIQAYREAVRINPRMSDAHFNIGNIYLERNQHGLALAHYKQALALRPNWEKARHALEQCEAVLKPAHTKPGTPVPAPAAKSEPEHKSEADGAKPEAVKVDQHRSVDPEKQGMLLTSLHKATVDSETMSRSFLKIMESEIEPVIKELSSCLLYPESGAHELERCLLKFETAIANMRGAQQDLKSSMQRVQKLGDRLLRS